MTHSIRMAEPADASTIARHRVQMFRDMGDLPDALVDSLEAAAAQRLAPLIASGIYVGWLVETVPGGHVVAGVGLYLRDLLPRPFVDASGATRLIDREGIVLNAYTEPVHRRRGLARAMMGRLLEWTRENAIDRVVLHASEAGRPLYEQLGFAATNEMRLVPSAAVSRP